MRPLALALAIPFLLSAILAQEPSSTHRVSGTIKNKQGAVVPILWLAIYKDGKRLEKNGKEVNAVTGIDGRFEIDLPEGDYKITARGIFPEHFSLFLKIDNRGLAPKDLDIIVDTSDLCDPTGVFPKIRKAVVPDIPPAARAVRASGDVSVSVNVSDDGSVSSTRVLSGHPLLREASRVAAKQFLFETSDVSTKRNPVLTFTFTDLGVKRDGVKRYECPYRIIIHSVKTIQTTGVDE